MKVFLFPCVAAASAAQEDVTSLLQAAKIAKMFERSNSTGAMNALDASVSGKTKKGEEHNVCDEEEAAKLVNCINFAGFKMQDQLGGNGSWEIFDDSLTSKIMETTFNGVLRKPNRTYWEEQGHRVLKSIDNGSTLVYVLGAHHKRVQTSCAAMKKDMKCMQTNSCWKKAISSWPHEKIQGMCKGLPMEDPLEGMAGLVPAKLCAMTGSALCNSLTKEQDVQDYLELCAHGGKDVMKCDANIVHYGIGDACDLANSTLAKTTAVTSESECEAAANVLGWRFHKISKRLKRRPKGCYNYQFHGKETAYWNPRTSGKERLGKKRKPICVV